MSLTRAVREAAYANPEGIASATLDERVTWKQASGRIASLATELRSRGIEPGDRVAILALNSWRHFEAQLAVWYAGAVLVPINTRLALDEMRHIVSDSGASYLVCDKRFENVGDILVNSCSLQGMLNLDDARHADFVSRRVMQDESGGERELAAIFYTGGTTGRPKGVMLSHLNFATAAAGMQRDLAHSRNTVYLHAAPLFHLADFGIALGVTRAAGSHSFMSSFSPAVFYDRLRYEGVTHLQLVPTMLSSVLDAPERDDSLLANIRSISYGAAPIAEGLLARVLDAFPKSRLVQFYGMTECCGAGVMLPPERHLLTGPTAGKLRSIGQPIEGFEVKIVDEGMTEQPCGSCGEIAMRSDSVMMGYWDSDEATSRTIVDGWLRSGDVGWKDDDGFIYIVDRLKDMIISGGENIYCAEVENAISSHPAVAMIAVIGVPDDKWGERVHAVVVLRPEQEVSAEELDWHCRAHIAGYKVPRSYEIRRDPLPLSGVGKVQKNVLREQWFEVVRNRESTDD